MNKYINLGKKTPKYALRGTPNRHPLWKAFMVILGDRRRRPYYSPGFLKLLEESTPWRIKDTGEFKWEIPLPQS